MTKQQLGLFYERRLLSQRRTFVVLATRLIQMIHTLKGWFFFKCMYRLGWLIRTSRLFFNIFDLNQVARQGGHSLGPTCTPKILPSTYRMNVRFPYTYAYALKKWSKGSNKVKCSSKSTQTHSVKDINLKKGYRPFVDNRIRWLLDSQAPERKNFPIANECSGV